VNIDIISIIVKNKMARLNPMSLGIGIIMSLGITGENYINFLEKDSEWCLLPKGRPIYVR
jgi:hypothetical protein